MAGLFTCDFCSLVTHEVSRKVADSNEADEDQKKEDTGDVTWHSSARVLSVYLTFQDFQDRKEDVLLSSSKSLPFFQSVSYMPCVRVALERAAFGGSIIQRCSDFRTFCAAMSFLRQPLALTRRWPKFTAPTCGLEMCRKSIDEEPSSSSICPNFGANLYKFVRGKL